MSKEYLEAFKNLKQELYYSPNQIPDVDKWHETIEEALQRLEAIDNAKPSEALKWLEHTGEQWVEQGIYDDVVQYKETQSYKEIKQALIKSQEQEKVLDILFKKEVDINLLSRSIDSKSYNYSCDYVKGYNFSENKEITEEEHELLKRYYNER